MNRFLILSAGLILMTASISAAGVERVDEGGQELSVSDHSPGNEPVIIVFYTSWDTESSGLADDVESWSSTYSGLNIIIVDVGDLRSQVCRQFDIDELPSIIVLDDREEQVGGTVDNIEDLETILSDEDMI